MTAVAALPPSPSSVALGILAVLAGALVASTAAWLAHRTRNWLHHITTAGGLTFVAGVVGQRHAVAGTAMGPWDAGITVPLTGLQLDPVAAAGIIICLLGVVLALLFERVPDPGARPAPLVHRPLEDDDTI